MERKPKARITVDFPMPERDALQFLCDTDLRPPAEQLRWLVLTEAKRRGILTDAKQHETAVPALTGTGGGFVEVNP